MGDDDTPETVESTTLVEFNRTALPEWTKILFDICDVFKKSKESRVDQMFGRGVIDQKELHDLVGFRLDKMNHWANASKEFHRRFGTDYSKNEYNVTWSECDGYEGDQWYLSTLTEMLIQNYNSDITTYKEWRDTEEGQKAYVVVTPDGKR